MDRITVQWGHPLDVVLRRSPNEDWADGLVASEADALVTLRNSRVPAPDLLALDEDGASTGVRCTLTSALAGQPDLRPNDLRSWLDQLASTQATIHAVPGLLQAHFDGRYTDSGRPLDWLTDEGLRDAATRQPP